MLGRAVVRKLQRAVVAGNRFSERTSPPVQNTFGFEFRASWSLRSKSAAKRNCTAFYAALASVCVHEGHEVVISHALEM